MNSPKKTLYFSIFSMNQRFIYLIKILMLSYLPILSCFSSPSLSTQKATYSQTWLLKILYEIGHHEFVPVWSIEYSDKEKIDQSILTNQVIEILRKHGLLEDRLNSELNYELNKIMDDKEIFESYVKKRFEYLDKENQDREINKFIFESYAKKRFEYLDKENQDRDINKFTFKYLGYAVDEFSLSARKFFDIRISKSKFEVFKNKKNIEHNKKIKHIKSKLIIFPIEEIKGISKNRDILI